MNFKEIVESSIAQNNELHEGFLNKVAYNAKIAGMKLSHTLTKQRFLTGFNSKSGKEHLDAAADELNLDHRLQPSTEALRHLAKTIISNPNADAIHLNAAKRHMDTQDDVLNLLNHPNSSQVIGNSTRLQGIYNDSKDGKYEENISKIGHHPKTPINTKLSILDRFKRIGNTRVANSIATQIIHNPTSTTEHLNQVLSHHSNNESVIDHNLALSALQHKNANNETIRHASLIHSMSGGVNQDLEKELSKHINKNIDALSSIATTTKNHEMINKLLNTSKAHQSLSVNKNLTDEHLGKLIANVKTNSEAGWRNSTTLENIMSHPNKGEQTLHSAAKNIYHIANDLASRKDTSPSVLRTIYDNHSMLRDKVLKHPNGEGLRKFGLPTK